MNKGALIGIVIVVGSLILLIRGCSASPYGFLGPGTNWGLIGFGIIGIIAGCITTALSIYVARARVIEIQESDLDQIADSLDSLVRAANAGDVENLMSLFAPERHEFRAEVQEEVQERVRDVARYAIDYAPLDQNTKPYLSRSDGAAQVHARLSASGEGWELNDSPTFFHFEKQNDRWLIRGTDFHWKLGAPRKPISERVGKVFTDRSTWFLLLSNVVTIVLAVTQGWCLITLMWIYWFQSVAIGVTNTIRILQLEEFSTRGVRVNRRPVEATKATKKSAARFFALHYGGFHLGFLPFLLRGEWTVDYRHILPLACLFFANHLFSYFYNRPRDTKRPNIGTLMFYPYVRMLPMTIVIATGVYVGGGVVLFALLKTVADIIMHGVEHGVLRKGEAAKSQAGEPEPAKAEAGNGDDNDASHAES